MNLLSKTLLPAALSLFFLHGCTAATDTPATASSPATPATPLAATASKYSGAVETANGRYAFTPTICGIHMEDGVADIEVQGPGTALDGEKIFVEFSSTANALDIKLGVDKPFSSSDRTLKAGQFVTNNLQIEVSGKTIRVPSLELVDADGNRQPGSLEINC